jgi:hypothetical protein
MHEKCLLSGYALHLQGMLALTNRATSKPRWYLLTHTTFIALLITIGILWAIFDYARTVGDKLAHGLETDLVRAPSVVVYSKQQLHISAPGVSETALSNTEAAYRFRYTGLRLLIRPGGKYLLVPRSWSRASGTAFLLPDSNSLRLEFTTRAQ